MRVPLRPSGLRVPRPASPARTLPLLTTRRSLYSSPLAREPAASSSAQAVPVGNRAVPGGGSTGSATPDNISGFRSDNGPVARYEQLVQDGTLSDDPFQRTIAAKFQSLYDAMRNHAQVPPEAPPTTVQTAKQWIIDHPLSSASNNAGVLGKLLSAVGWGRSSSPAPSSTKAAADAPMPPTGTPRGLYLYGDVGTGKSMLMDLFYDTLPDRVTRKQRIHFHQFMIDVHKRAHHFKQLFSLATNARASNLSSASAGDAQVPTQAGQQHLQADITDLVAREIANKAEVLCFDEFQVTDIADAMILRSLLTRLIVDYGVVVVLTSNRHPTELYRNGIQRESFVPAIHLLQRALDVVDLDSGTDYRRRERAQTRVYFDEHQPADQVVFNDLWDRYLHAAGGPPAERQNEQVEVWGRTLTVPSSIHPTPDAPTTTTTTGEIPATTVAKFDFHALCGSPTSAADYIAVCRAYRVVFVQNVPRLGIDQRDVARRFITFIDAVYEAHTQLILSTDGPVLHLFLDPSKNGKEDDSYDPTVHRMLNDQGLTSDTLSAGKPIFAGEEELFAFARVLSRLTEMGTVAYANKSKALSRSQSPPSAQQAPKGSIPTPTHHTTQDAPRAS